MAALPRPVSAAPAFASAAPPRAAAAAPPPGRALPRDRRPPQQLHQPGAQRPRSGRPREAAAAAAAAPPGGGGGGGGPAPATLAETAALDELIDALLAAGGADALSRRVAENALSFDQRFWLRLAARADSAPDAESREALTALARVVMQLVDAMVRATSQQLDSSAATLQEILAAGADPATGEWAVPLPAERAAAMAAALAARADRLDEALLSNAFAWMQKAGGEGLDGMVALLQKVLQLYAAHQLGGGGAGAGAGGGAEGLVARLLAADEATWEFDIRAAAAAGAADPVGEAAFFEALQRRMEAVVLGLPSGSYAQRVQAEYLKEVEARARRVYAALAAEG